MLSFAMGYCTKRYFHVNYNSKYCTALVVNNQTFDQPQMDDQKSSPVFPRLFFCAKS